MKKSKLILTALIAAMAVTACSKPAAPAKENSSAAESTVAADGNAAVSEEETTEETTAETKPAIQYGILSGTVKEGTEEDLEVVITADDGTEYTVGPLSIPYIDTQVEPGHEISIVYSGELSGTDLDDLDLYYMLDKAEIEIKDVTGTTYTNAMSTFAMKDESGQEFGFEKGACVIEEGALSQDSGDKVKVTYANVVSNGYIYALRVEKAQ